MSAPDARTPARLFDAPPPSPPEDNLATAAMGLPVPAYPTNPDGAVAWARTYLGEGRAFIEGLHNSGASGRTVVRLHSLLVDRLLASAWEAGAERHGSPTGCLVAIGGYGRSELAPWSDIDLLFVYPDDEQDAPALEGLAESILYLLWDTGLQVGHAVRSPNDCLDICEEDHTARTALFDCRYLAGDRQLYESFEGRMLGGVHSRRVAAYLEDKLDEWRGRHNHFGQTVFRLEPNVKSGLGGLRDLHTALWIARARWHVAGLGELAQKMLLPRGELSDARAARDFLWRVRNALHYRAGRRQDHLTFDAQEAVARSLGYEDQGHTLGIEAFMRDFYLSARTLLRVARSIIDRASPPKRARPGDRDGGSIGDGLKLFQGQIAADGNDVFEKDPSLVFRAFREADVRDLPIHAHTRDLIREAARSFGEAEREDPRVATAFRELLTRPGTDGNFLLQMHQLGVLGSLIPEFGRQAGLWQHDLYHVYTVDVHSLFAMQRVMELRAGRHTAAPFLAPLVSHLEDPMPLLRGTWFHDIGKGLGGGHAVKGAAMMPEVCRRLGLSAEDADTVRWLVEDHLRMSHVAQRRDLSDPELIASFAKEVGSLERLDMLYVLTYADISTTGESTWNDWKAMLLAELHAKCRAVLLRTGEGVRPFRFDLGRRVAEAREALGPALKARVDPAAVDAFLEEVPARYLAAVDPRRAGIHLALLKRQVEKGAAIRRIQHRRKGYSEIIVAARDREGLLADTTACLAAHRLDILGADIWSLSDGRVLDVFLVRDLDGAPLESGPFWKVLSADLTRAVLEPGAGEAMARERARPSPLGKRPAPPVPVKVHIDNEDSADHTVIDIYARDRLGLLWTITRTLHALGLSVALARVATEAHRATDAFYVTDATGRKLEDPARLESVRDALAEALERVDASGEPEAP